MPRYSSPVLIGRPIGTTNDGSTPLNSSGFGLGDTIGAASVSREFLLSQTVTGNSVNLNIYQEGVAGVLLSGTTITVPSAASQVAASLPAGARIQGINAYVLTVPGGTTPTIAVNINGVTIATSAAIAGVGPLLFTFALTTAAIQYIIGGIASDSQVTIFANGTGLTGSIVGEISLQYTVRRASGSIIQTGQGLTNDGTNSNIL